LPLSKTITDLGGEKVKVIKLIITLRVMLQHTGGLGRKEGLPISGPILQEKAVQLYKKMYGEASEFTGSTGWQWRFLKGAQPSAYSKHPRKINEKIN